MEAPAAPVSGVRQTGSRQWFNPDAFASVVDPSTGACAEETRAPIASSATQAGRNNYRGPHFTYSAVYLTKKVPSFGALTSTISPPTGLLGVGLGGDSSPRMIAFQRRIEF